MKSKRTQKDKWATTLGAAATALDSSVDALKTLRDSGCTGFHQSGRVNISEVQRYIAKHGKTPLETPKDGATLREQKISQEIRKLRIANDEKEKILMPRADHDNELREMASAVQKELYRLPGRCAVELPGLDPVAIENLVKTMVNDCIVSLRNG